MGGGKVGVDLEQSTWPLLLKSELLWGKIKLWKLTASLPGYLHILMLLVVSGKILEKMDSPSMYSEGSRITATGYFKIFLHSHSIWKIFFATFALDGKSYFSRVGFFCLTIEMETLP